MMTKVARTNSIKEQLPSEKKITTGLFFQATIKYDLITEQVDRWDTQASNSGRTGKLESYKCLKLVKPSQIPRN